MVTRGLLHHPLRPPSPLHLAELTSRLGRRFVLNRPALPPKLYGATQSKVPLGSVQCMKHEEPAGSDGEVLEWVNKTPRDPMVELDPVTVFRRIVAERRASISTSLARATAKDEEQANLALQTGSSTPFIFGRQWPGNSGIALVITLVLLALTVALYMLRSRKEKQKAMEVSLADTNDILGLSCNGRRKLVQDSVKASESVLMAMAIGAASVSRPKGLTGATQGTLHSTNGNALESQGPQGGTDIHRTVNTVAVEDAKSEFHGKLTFDQAPNCSNLVEDSIPLKFENSGIDVTEGPWFGQGVIDNDMLGPPQELEPGKPEEAESEKLEDPETEDFVQMLDFKVEESQVDGNLAEDSTPAETPEYVVEENPIKFLEAKDDTVCLDQNMDSGMVDGEFYGQAAGVSEQINPNSVPIIGFKVEESEVYGCLAENSSSFEEPEQVVEGNSIKSLEAKDDTVCPDQNMESGTVDGEFYGQVVAVSEQVNPNSVQALDFKVEEVEESQVDGISAENSTPAEKSEKVVEEDSIKSLEAKDGTVFPDQNMESGSSASDFSGETDWESNDDSDDNECHGIYLINQDGSVISLDDANDRKGGLKEKFAEPYLPDPKLDCPSTKEQDSNPHLLSGVDQTLSQGIDTGSEDGFDDVSLPATTFQMDQLDKEEGLVDKSLTENCESFNPMEYPNLDPGANSTILDAARQASEEESREESKKALQAAMPALAMGVGTVGALFGVAGGLQVVGFAALASLVSHDFLWANSRESLWQELNGITDRQKLLDFLTRRNIMRTGQEKSSL